MFPSVSAFFVAAEPFITAFDTWVAQYTPAARADHICFKCGDTEEYEHLRALFESDSEYIYQSIISQRRIAIIKFTQPIQTRLGAIWYLELSDQKPDNSQARGFDHIELYPTTGTMQALGETLKAQGMPLEIVERPHHTTIDGAIHASFKIRLEPNALIEKIVQEELGLFPVIG